MAPINIGDRAKQGKEEGGSEEIQGPDMAGMSGPWVGFGFIFSKNRTNLSSGSALKLDLGTEEKVSRREWTASAIPLTAI